MALLASKLIFKNCTFKRINNLISFEKESYHNH